MGCDYYTQSELIILYIDENGAVSKITTNKIVNKCYIYYIPGADSDDDFETLQMDYNTEVQRIVNENTYIKILYEDDKWVKSSYEEIYSTDLKIICQKMVKLLKVYKNYVSWQANCTDPKEK